VRDPHPEVHLRMQRGRFVYVNVGTYAGGPPSPWSRRAKVPLGRITPAAATVPLLGAGWSVVIVAG
jgi:hypothetical protein